MEHIERVKYSDEIHSMQSHDLNMENKTFDTTRIKAIS